MRKFFKFLTRKIKYIFLFFIYFKFFYYNYYLIVKISVMKLQK